MRARRQRGGASQWKVVMSTPAWSASYQFALQPREPDRAAETLIRWRPLDRRKRVRQCPWRQSSQPERPRRATRLGTNA